LPFSYPYLHGTKPTLSTLLCLFSISLPSKQLTVLNSDTSLTQIHTHPHTYFASPDSDYDISHLAFFYFHNHIHIGFKLVIVHLYFYWIQTLFSSFLFFFVETPFWSICLIATYFINTCMSHSPGLYHVKTSIDI
jgi:hypothetical protein